MCGRWRIIRMERGAQGGQSGRLDTNFCSFKVSNLTDHDDVGVLAQERPQGRREI